MDSRSDSGFLNILIQIGEALQNSGAEIYRVEDTLESYRLCLWCRRDECVRDYLQHYHYHEDAWKRAIDPDQTAEEVRG